MRPQIRGRDALGVRLGQRENGTLFCFLERGGGFGVEKE